MKKKMSNRDKTFWAVVIPVVILFFAFNTLPMIKGVPIIKDTERTIMSGSGTMQICLRIPAWEKAMCLRLNMHWQERYW